MKKFVVAWNDANVSKGSKFCSYSAFWKHNYWCPYKHHIVFKNEEEANRAASMSYEAYLKLIKEEKEEKYGQWKFEI